MHRNTTTTTTTGWRFDYVTFVIILIISSASTMIYWRWTLQDRDVLQRKFWDNFYNQFSILYDSVDWLTFDSTQKLRLRVLEEIPITPTTAGKFKVLEIGVGTGRLHTEIAKQRPNIDYLAGIDLAPGMIQLTKKRLKHLSQEDHKDSSISFQSDLRVEDITNGLPWGENTFDIVLSTFVLSAISQAPKAIDEMVRVLKPGGKVVIVDAGVAAQKPREDNTCRNWNWMISSIFASMWELLGDYIRDDSDLLSQTHLVTAVSREDYGPFHSVHITVGTKE